MAPAWKLCDESSTADAYASRGDVELDVLRERRAVVVFHRDRFGDERLAVAARQRVPDLERNGAPPAAPRDTRAARREDHRLVVFNVASGGRRHDAARRPLD